MAPKIGKQRNNEWRSGVLRRGWEREIQKKKSKTVIGGVSERVRESENYKGDDDKDISKSKIVSKREQIGSSCQEIKWIVNFIKRF